MLTKYKKLSIQFTAVNDCEFNLIQSMDASRAKSPTLSKRVRSLVNFKGGHEMFVFDPTEPDSIQKMRDRYKMKRQQKLTTKQD